MVVFLSFFFWLSFPSKPRWSRKTKSSGNYTRKTKIFHNLGYMSKKMAKFRQKKIKPQKEHVTYLPTYLHTYQSSRLALYQAHHIPEWNGPPMFLLYCSKPKKKKTLNSFTSSQRKKHWATIPLFHIELVSTLFLFVFFLFFHLGNFHQRSGPKGTFGNFSRVKCVPQVPFVLVQLGWRRCPQKTLG